jgi:hypothetical protein
MTDAQSKTRGRQTFLVLVALFLAPLAFAFWLYYGSTWRPSLTTNNGQLIRPARLLPDSAATHRANGARIFDDKWSLVVVADNDCDAVCRNGLEYAQRTLASLGRQQSRTQYVLVHSGACCKVDWAALGHKDLLVVDGAAAPGLLAVFPESKRGSMIFIVDPLGFLLMSYDSSLDPKGLRADLKHLLDLSQIG